MSSIDSRLPLQLRILRTAAAASLVFSVACARASSGGRPGQVGFIGRAVSDQSVNFAVSAEPSLSSDSVAATVGQVWQALPQVFADLGIPLAVVDVQNQRLGNGGFQPRRLGGERLSQFLDCGYSIAVTSYADAYRVTMSLFSRVREDENQATLLETEIYASAEPITVRGEPVNCTSKGTLERRIVGMVQAQLCTPPDPAAAVTPATPEHRPAPESGDEDASEPTVNRVARPGTISRIWSSPFFHFGVMLTTVVVFAASLGKSFHF